MSFLDDIGDAIGDVAKTVGDGVSTLATEAYSTVLSPSDSFAMKGLGAASSAVSELFGDLDITDVSEKVTDIGQFAASPAAGLREAFGGLIQKSSLPEFFGNNSIADMLKHNSVAEIIETNPLAGMAYDKLGQNITDTNKDLFDFLGNFKS